MTPEPWADDDYDGQGKSQRQEEFDSNVAIVYLVGAVLLALVVTAGLGLWWAL